MSKATSDKDVVWPVGTLLLFGVSIAVFGLVAMGRIPNVLDYVLYFDKEVQYLQCLTSLFIHLSNPAQIVVCMLFLLILGTVVEMRIGLQWTVALFVGLGYTGQVVAQMVSFATGNSGGSLGAATGISGLAGLLLVWSPQAKVSHLSKISLNKIILPVWVYIVGWFLADAVVYTGILGLGAVSLSPHLIAFFLGGLTAVVLLQKKVLEGDNQDLFTIISGSGPGGRKVLKQEALIKKQQAEEEEKAAKLVSDAQLQLEEFLTRGQLSGALGLLTKMSDLGTKLSVSRTQMVAIIRGLHKQNQWEDSIPWLQQYLEQYPDDVAMRLKLAQIFVVEQRLPGSAMEVLKPLEDASLNEADDKLYRKIVRAADSMWEDDDIQLELQKRDW